jgi:hypothetical protein
MHKNQEKQGGRFLFCFKDQKQNKPSLMIDWHLTYSKLLTNLGYKCSKIYMASKKKLLSGFGRKGVSFNLSITF